MGSQYQVVLVPAFESGDVLGRLAQQQIVQGERLEAGRQVVVPVRAPAGDPQAQVYLGVRGERDPTQRSISNSELAWASASSR